MGFYKFIRKCNHPGRKPRVQHSDSLEFRNILPTIPNGYIDSWHRIKFCKLVKSSDSLFNTDRVTWVTEYIVNI